MIVYRLTLKLLDQEMWICYLSNSHVRCCEFEIIRFYMMRRGLSSSTTSPRFLGHNQKIIRFFVIFFLNHKNKNKRRKHEISLLCWEVRSEVTLSELTDLWHAHMKIRFFYNLVSAWMGWKSKIGKYFIFLGVSLIILKCN